MIPYLNNCGLTHVKINVWLTKLLHYNLKSNVN